MPDWQVSIYLKAMRNGLIEVTLSKIVFVETHWSRGQKKSSKIGSEEFAKEFKEEKGSP